MKYPAFVAEMAAPANRAKLRFGIWSGFAIAIGFGVLAAAAAFFGLTPWRWAFVGLVGIKLLTNSIAWLCLVKDRAVMETQGLNTMADVVLLTAAMYFTGGAYSPLFPTYVIVIAVLSLLSNLGVTILMASITVACFALMMILLTTGVRADAGPGLARTGADHRLCRDVDRLLRVRGRGAGVVLRGDAAAAAREGG